MLVPITPFSLGLALAMATVLVVGFRIKWPEDWTWRSAAIMFCVSTMVNLMALSVHFQWRSE